MTVSQYPQVHDLENTGCVSCERDILIGHQILVHYIKTALNMDISKLFYS